jgi:hypothetical protein
MKVIRTPEEHYFEGGCVKFSTSRKDGELYYQIWYWNDDKTAQFALEVEKVKDEAHLKELQCMEKEIEN